MPGPTFPGHFPEFVSESSFRTQEEGKRIYLWRVAALGCLLSFPRVSEQVCLFFRSSRMWRTPSGRTGMPSIPSWWLRACLPLPTFSATCDSSSCTPPAPSWGRYRYRREVGTHGLHPHYCVLVFTQNWQNISPWKCCWSPLEPPRIHFLIGYNQSWLDCTSGECKALLKLHLVTGPKS